MSHQIALPIARLSKGEVVKVVTHSISGMPPCWKPSFRASLKQDFVRSTLVIFHPFCEGFRALLAFWHREMDIRHQYGTPSRSHYVVWYFSPSE